MGFHWTFFKYRCCSNKKYKFLNLNAPHMCLSYQQKVSTISTLSRWTPKITVNNSVSNQMCNMVTIYPSFIEILDIFEIFVIISTFNIEFLWQPRFSWSLSPSGCLCQIWRNSLRLSQHIKFTRKAWKDNLKNIMLHPQLLPALDMNSEQENRWRNKHRW